MPKALRAAPQAGGPPVWLAPTTVKLRAGSCSTNRSWREEYAERRPCPVGASTGSLSTPFPSGQPRARRAFGPDDGERPLYDSPGLPVAFPRRADWRADRHDAWYRPTATSILCGGGPVRWGGWRMLVVGTRHGLRDLDSGETFVDGMAVTAIAPGGAGGWYALLDRRFVVGSTRTQVAPCRRPSWPSPTGRVWPCSPTGP